MPGTAPDEVNIAFSCVTGKTYDIAVGASVTGTLDVVDTVVATHDGVTNVTVTVPVPVAFGRVHVHGD